MIDKTLDFVLGELNAELGRRFPIDGAHAILSPVVRQDGTPPEETVNRIVVTLVNIERGAVTAQAAPRSRARPADRLRVKPTLYVNLLLLISMNFDANYADSLKLLSAVMSFFQARPVLTPQSSPDLPPSLERLSVEWVGMDLQSISDLWASLGSPYRPSVVYRIGTLPLQEESLPDQMPAVTVRT
jgi:Pvc16 N-terminal domain